MILRDEILQKDPARRTAGFFVESMRSTLAKHAIDADPTRHAPFVAHQSPCLPSARHAFSMMTQALGFLSRPEPKNRRRFRRALRYLHRRRLL